MPIASSSLCYYWKRRSWKCFPKYFVYLFIVRAWQPSGGIKSGADEPSVNFRDPSHEKNNLTDWGNSLFFKTWNIITIPYLKKWEKYSSSEEIEGAKLFIGQRGPSGLNWEGSGRLTHRLSYAGEGGSIGAFFRIGFYLKPITRISEILGPMFLGPRVNFRWDAERSLVTFPLLHYLTVKIWMLLSVL